VEDARPAPNRFFTPANALTYSRLLFMPAAMVGLVTNTGWLTAGAIFSAWVTDLLDGRVARRMGQGGTPFGKALDSTVDFALLYCMFIAFYAAGRLEHYQFGFLYLAMLMILTLQLFLTGTGKEEEVATTRLGKPTGAMQYAYLLFLGAQEVLPETDLLWTIDTVYFGIMAALILANSVECVLAMRKLIRES